MARKNQRLEQRHFLNQLQQRRRIKAARQRRKSLSEGLMRSPFERLEDRHLLAAINWDGGGDNETWGDPLNWDGDVLPTVADQVFIQDASSELLVRIDTNVVVESIDTSESLEVVGSELRTSSLTAHEVTFDNGILNPIAGQPLVADIAGELTVTGSASQFVILGNVHVGGDLVLRRGLTLTASGADAELTVDGHADLQGVNLRAEGGGVLSFPGLETFHHMSVEYNEDLFYTSTGTDSRIEFPNLQSIAGGTHEGADMFIRAQEGGAIAMPVVTTILNPNRGDRDFRSIDFRATGAGSEIDLSSLQYMQDRDRDEPSVLLESGGGDIKLGMLQSAIGLNITLDSDTDSPLQNLQHLKDTSLSLSGGDHTLANLVGIANSTMTVSAGSVTAGILEDLDGSSVVVSGGAVVSLPAVTRYRHRSTSTYQQRRLTATGPGSQLLLPSVVSIEGGSHAGSQLYIQTSEGGEIDLASVESIYGPEGGDHRYRRFIVTASDDSEIDLSSLVAITDYQRNSNANDNSLIESSFGADIIAPNLAYVRGVRLNLSDSGSMTSEQLLGISDSIVTIRDVDRAFPNVVQAGSTTFDIQNAAVDLSNLVDLNLGSLILRAGAELDSDALRNIDGADLYAYDGAVLSLPSVRAFSDTQSGNYHNRNWRAEGPGSRIEIVNLETLTGNSGYQTRHYFTATDGGAIELPMLKSVQDTSGDNRNGAFEFSSTQSGSLINLASLQQIVDLNADQRSIVRANTGGSINMGQLTNARGVNLIEDHTGSMSLTQLESLLDSRLTLSGNDVSLDQLLVADGTELVLSGVNLNIPLIESLVDGAVTASVGGSLTAPLLTNIDGADFDLSDGVTISLPGVTHYRHAGSGNYVDRSWLVDGVGTRLELPNLISIEGGEYYDTDMTIRASSGGVIDLSSVEQLRDVPDGDNRYRAFLVTAQGADSEIDFSSLTAMIDRRAAAEVKVNRANLMLLTADRSRLPN